MIDQLEDAIREIVNKGVLERTKFFFIIFNCIKRSTKTGMRFADCKQFANCCYLANLSVALCSIQSIDTKYRTKPKGEETGLNQNAICKGGHHYFKL